MPTADRTTLRAAVDEWVNKLRSNLTANPPTAARPFWRVAVGEANAEALSRPALTLQLVRSRPVSTSDDDRVFEVTVEMRIVTDVAASDPHGAILDKIGALEDYLDGIRDSGVIAGAEGLDDRMWQFTYPTSNAGSRTMIAESEQSFVVKVQRAFNRTVAP